jgi:type I restriction enzyme S subunit
MNADVQRGARLRQALLKWAFEGKLVDQAPTDEPAEKLLARIRAERAAVSPTKKGLSRKAKGVA